MFLFVSIFVENEGPFLPDVLFCTFYGVFIIFIYQNSLRKGKTYHQGSGACYSRKVSWDLEEGEQNKRILSSFLNVRL